MIRPHHPGLLNRIGKAAAPVLARIIMTTSLRQLIPLFETYLAIIQGKGSGTGWDVQGEVSCAVSHIQRPDPVIFDVGAHKGAWSVCCVNALRSSKYRLFQFEPSEHCSAILRSLNLPQTTVIQAAVGDRRGIGTLYSPDPGSPLTALHPRRDSFCQGYNLIEEKVQVVTIDDAMEEFKVDTVDFIKLDIEGNELAALRGARNSLKAKRIKALAFEFGSGHINSRCYFRDFWDLLQPHGYVINRICPGGILLPIEEYYEDLEYFRGVTNYLVVQR